MGVSDLQHAEQGSTVRIPFSTLSGGSPIVPTTVAVTVHPGQDSVPAAVATLTPATVDVGRFTADWAIPRDQAIGFYTTFIDADIGTGPSSYTDLIRFEVFVEGNFVPQTETLPNTAATSFSALSQKRNKDSFIQLVRSILRDHPQINRLTEGHEHSAGDISIALAMAISIYNTTPPIFSGVQSIGNFPSLAMLVIGTIGWLLNSTTLGRSRNDLQYADGNVTVNAENVPVFMNLADKWWNQYIRWIPQFKVAENLKRGWGASPAGFNSEYELLSSFLGDSFSGVSFLG